MIAIGIDIGLTGAIGATDSRGTAAVRDMPTLPDGLKGRRIDGRALILLLRDLVPPGAEACVVFEDVRPRAFGNGGAGKTNSMHSQGSMMRSRGIVEAVCDITRLKAHAVQPQTWKRFYGLLKTEKGASIEKARVMFPSAAAELKRVKDHNRAEALLIAHFGLSEFA